MDMDILSEFILVHKQESDLAKRLKTLKERVKIILKDAGQSSCDIEGVGSVVIGESHSLKFDESKLVSYLQENFPQCIITEPKIDYTMLDNLIFENKEIAKELIPFQYEKVTERVSVKYAKN